MKTLETGKGRAATFLTPRTIAYAALLISLNIILTRYLSIQTPLLRISLNFLPLAAFSMLFGPVPGAVAAALADVVGFLLVPSGPFFPGFTISTAVAGLLYGLFLYKHEITFARVLTCALLVIALVDVLANTWFLTIINKSSFGAMIIPRLIKGAIMLPVQVASLLLFDQFIGRRVKTMFRL